MIKQIQHLSLLMVIFALASCSGDDAPANLAEEAIGQYSGYSNASSGYFSGMIADGQTVNITSSEMNKVDISYRSETWGTITINGAVLTGTEGNLHIAGTGKSVMAHAGNEAKEYDCTVEGTLIGKELGLTFSCPTVMGGLTIEFREGSIPAEIVVPGTYSGYTQAKSAYFPSMMADDQKIVITKNSDNTYRVEYGSDSWGEFLIEKAEAVMENGTFIVKGDGTTKMGMNGNIKDYNCTIEGKIDPGKESPTFTFAVPAVMGGLTIEFHTGDMPASE